MTGRSSQDHWPTIAIHIRVNTPGGLLRADPLCRPGHVGRPGRVAGEPQRHVRLDRGRQVAGAAMIVGPGPVLALAAADPAAAAAVRSASRMPRDSQNSRYSASVVTFVS